MRIKDIIYSRVIRFLSLLALIYSRALLKIRNKISRHIFLYAHSIALDTFPEKKIVECRKLALLSKNRLLLPEIDTAEFVAPVKDVLILEKLLEKDEIFTNLKALYFNIDAYFYKSGNIFKSKDLIRLGNDSLSKAKKYNPEIQELSNKTINKFKKNISNNLSKIQKIIELKETDRINDFEEKKFGNIEISTSSILFFISYFSYLLIITGFIYVFFVFGSLNIQISNYFTLADYTAVSIEEITPVAFSTAIAIISYIIGMRLGLRRYSENHHLYEVAQAPDKKKGIITFPNILLLVSVIGATYQYYSQQIIISNLFILACIIIYFNYIGELKFWNLIANQLAVKVFCLSTIVFILYLSQKITNDITTLNAGLFENSTGFILTDPYSEYKNYKLLKVNSSYVFLWHNKKGIIILPKSSVKLYHHLRNQTK